MMSLIRLPPVRLLALWAVALWLLALGAALCLLPAADSVAAVASPSGWQTVLVAGDNAQPVFDNAVASVRNWLTAGGVPAQNIHVLSATPQGSVLGAADPASAERVLAR